MSTGRAWFRGGVVAFVWRPDNDTYLLVRRSAAKSYGAGQWWLVTGTVEPGEGFPGALSREVAEELGAEIAASKILETTHFNRDSEDWLSASFLCTLKNPNRLILNQEHDAYEWKSAGEIEKIITRDQKSMAWVLTGLALAEQVKSELLL